MACWLLIDYGIILLAYMLAFSAWAITTPFNYSIGLTFIQVVAVVTLGLLYLFRAYNRIWSSTSGHDVTVLIKANLLSLVIVLVPYSLFNQHHDLPLKSVIVGHFLALIGFVALRYRSRLISGFSWRWKAVWWHKFPVVPARTLIVGADEAGQTLAWRLRYRNPPDQNYCIIGFVDDDPAKQGMIIEGRPILGTTNTIPALVEQHNVELIIIALYRVDGSDFRRILSLCEPTGARIKVVPNVFDVLSCSEKMPLLQDLQPEDFLGRKPITRNENVDLSLIMHKVVLVTGAAGSIGSELSRQLLTYDPIELILLDNNESELHDLVIELCTCYPASTIVPVLADITEKAILEQIIAKYSPQIIFHSAAYKHVPMLELYPVEAIRVNIAGTRNLAELAHDYGVERFVMISTDKAVDPVSIMGATKRIGELLMRALSGNHTLFTSVRFGNVLGSRGSVMPMFNRQIDAGGPVTVTHRDMTRYFITIPEAVNLVLHAACLTHGNDLFMLRMGDEVRIVELAERLIRMRGLRPYIDIAIQFTETRPGEKLHEQLSSPAEKQCETPHPDIVQLVSQAQDLCAESFLAQIDTLMSHIHDINADLPHALFAFLNTVEQGLDRAPAQVVTAEAVPPFPPPLPEQPSTGFSHKMAEEVLPVNKLPSIPMASPDITQADIDAVTEVMRTPWLSFGPKLKQFEGDFANYIGTKGAVAVSSGTSALHLAMLATGIGRGDEVITPSFSFIASTNCILYVGAKPVFVDVDPLTYNMYPLALEEAITERTKALIVVHAFGQPADMDPILEIARRHNLIVIEDACEAIGAEYKHRRVGTMADAAVFAFYPNKQMTTGEGGMLVSDREDWLELFRSLRNQGRDVFDSWLNHSRLGYNYRMDEMSAALGCSQLARIDEMLAKRAQVAEWYNKRIEHIPGLHKPVIASTTSRMSWFVYVVRCSKIDRNVLMADLAKHDVPSRPYFTPIHRQPFYQKKYPVEPGLLFNTENAGDSLLALPFSGIMTEEQVDYVCQQLRVAIAAQQGSRVSTRSRSTQEALSLGRNGKKREADHVQ